MSNVYSSIHSAASSLSRTLEEAQMKANALSRQTLSSENQVPSVSPSYPQPGSSTVFLDNISPRPNPAYPPKDELPGKGVVAPAPPVRASSRYGMHDQLDIPATPIVAYHIFRLFAGTYLIGLGESQSQVPSPGKVDQYPSRSISVPPSRFGETEPLDESFVAHSSPQFSRVRAESVRVRSPDAKGSVVAGEFIMDKRKESLLHTWRVGAPRATALSLERVFGSKQNNNNEFKSNQFPPQFVHSRVISLSPTKSSTASRSDFAASAARINLDMSLTSPSTSFNPLSLAKEARKSIEAEQESALMRSQLNTSGVERRFSLESANTFPASYAIQDSASVDMNLDLGGEALSHSTGSIPTVSTMNGQHSDTAMDIGFDSRASVASSRYTAHSTAGPSLDASQSSNLNASLKIGDLGAAIPPKPTSSSSSVISSIRSSGAAIVAKPPSTSSVLPSRRDSLASSHSIAPQNSLSMTSSMADTLSKAPLRDTARNASLNTSRNVDTLAETQAIREELEREVGDLKSEIQVLQSTLTETRENMVAEFRSKEHSVLAALDSIRAQKEESTSQTNKALMDALETISKLRAENTLLEEKRMELEVENMALKATLHDSHGYVSKMQERALGAVYNLDKLERKAESAEQVATTKAALAASLEDRILLLEDEISTLRSQLRVAQNAHANALDELDAARREASTKNSELLTFRVEVARSVAALNTCLVALSGGPEGKSSSKALTESLYGPDADIETSITNTKPSEVAIRTATPEALRLAVSGIVSKASILKDIDGNAKKAYNMELNRMQEDANNEIRRLRAMILAITGKPKTGDASTVGLDSMLKTVGGYTGPLGATLFGNSYSGSLTGALHQGMQVSSATALSMQKVAQSSPLNSIAASLSVLPPRLLRLVGLPNDSTLLPNAGTDLALQDGASKIPNTPFDTASLASQVLHAEIRISELKMALLAAEERAQNAENDAENMRMVIEAAQMELLEEQKKQQIADDERHGITNTTVDDEIEAAVLGSMTRTKFGSSISSSLLSRTTIEKAKPLTAVDDQRTFAFAGNSAALKDVFTAIKARIPASRTKQGLSLTFRTLDLASNRPGTGQFITDLTNRPSHGIGLAGYILLTSEMENTMNQLGMPDVEKPENQAMAPLAVSATLISPADFTSILAMARADERIAVLRNVYNAAMADTAHGAEGSLFADPDSCDRSVSSVGSMNSHNLPIRHTDALALARAAAESAERETQSLLDNLKHLQEEWTGARERLNDKMREASEVWNEGRNALRNAQATMERARAVERIAIRDRDFAKGDLAAARELFKREEAKLRAEMEEANRAAQELQHDLEETIISLQRSIDLLKNEMSEAEEAHKKKIEDMTEQFNKELEALQDEMKRVQEEHREKLAALHEEFAQNMKDIEEKHEATLRETEERLAIEKEAAVEEAKETTREETRALCEAEYALVLKNELQAAAEAALAEKLAALEEQKNDLIQRFEEDMATMRRQLTQAHEEATQQAAEIFEEEKQFCVEEAIAATRKEETEKKDAEVAKIRNEHAEEVTIMNRQYEDRVEEMRQEFVGKEQVLRTDMQRRIDEYAADCEAQIDRTIADCDAEIQNMQQIVKETQRDYELKSNIVETDAQMRVLEAQDNANRKLIAVTGWCQTLKTLVGNEISRRRQLSIRLFELQGHIRVHIRIKPTAKQLQLIAHAEAHGQRTENDGGEGLDGQIDELVAWIEQSGGDVSDLDLGAGSLLFGPREGSDWSLPSLANSTTTAATKTLRATASALDGTAYTPAINARKEANPWVKAGPYGTLTVAVPTVIAGSDVSTADQLMHAATQGASSHVPLSRKHYEFDQVHGPYATQASIFHPVVPMLDVALAGTPATIFAYGQSQSGKTYTMEGTPDKPGLVVRSLEYLFKQAESTAKVPTRDSRKVSFSISVMEVYNDKVTDLLTGVTPIILAGAVRRAPLPNVATITPEYLEALRTQAEKISRLRPDTVHQRADTKASLSPSRQKTAASGATGKVVLRETQHGSVETVGLTRISVNSLEEALVCIQIASSMKSIHAATKLNNAAHILTRIYVHGPWEEAIAARKASYRGTVPVSEMVSVTFVDLTGSDRVPGARGAFHDNIAVNSSLTSLYKVITAIRNNKQHIPFRESKLTYLLRDSFLGRAKVLFLACVSGDMLDLLETQATVDFADRCRNTALLKDDEDYLFLKKNSVQNFNKAANTSALIDNIKVAPQSIRETYENNETLQNTLRNTRILPPQLPSRSSSRVQGSIRSEFSQIPGAQTSRTSSQAYDAVSNIPNFEQDLQQYLEASEYEQMHGQVNPFLYNSYDSQVSAALGPSATDKTRATPVQATYKDTIVLNDSDATSSNFIPASSTSASANKTSATRSKSNVVHVATKEKEEPELRPTNLGKVIHSPIQSSSQGWIPENSPMTISHELDGFPANGNDSVSTAYESGSLRVHEDVAANVAMEDAVIDDVQDDMGSPSHESPSFTESQSYEDMEYVDNHMEGDLKPEIEDSGMDYDFEVDLAVEDTNSDKSASWTSRQFLPPQSPYTKTKFGVTSGIALSKSSNLE